MRRRWLFLLGAVAVLLIPALAHARPGGGEGYSGGGGGGDGGGDGGFIFLLLRLWFEFVIHYPAIGIPMTIAGIIVFLVWKKRRGSAGSQNWDLTPQHVAPPTRPRSFDLDSIRQADDRFGYQRVQVHANQFAFSRRKHPRRAVRSDANSRRGLGERP